MQPSSVDHSATNAYVWLTDDTTQPESDSNANRSSDRRRPIAVIGGAFNQSPALGAAMALKAWPCQPACRILPVDVCRRCVPPVCPMVVECVRIRRLVRRWASESSKLPMQILPSCPLCLLRFPAELRFGVRAWLQLRPEKLKVPACSRFSLLIRPSGQAGIVVSTENH